MRICAASAGVLASDIARSKAVRASSFRPNSQQERALDPEEVEIAGKWFRQGLDHRQRGLRPVHLHGRHGAIEGYDRRRLYRLERRVEQIDLLPVGKFGLCGACM